MKNEEISKEKDEGIRKLKKTTNKWNRGEERDRWRQKSRELRL